jgi:hypothetical protein
VKATTPRGGLALLWFVNVLVPLVLGASFYVLFRPSPPIVASVRAWLGMQLSYWPSALPAILFDTLPDALWAYGLTATARLLWIAGPARARTAWTMATFVVTGGWELGQLGRFLPGSFSLGDLLASIAASVLAVWLVPVREPNCQNAREELTHATCNDR